MSDWLMHWWTDPRLLALDDGARCVFLALLTGPPRERGLPGLIVAHPGIVAIELVRDAAAVTEHYESLIRNGLIQFDPLVNLVRIPEPERVGRPNPNVLRAWWARWQRLPESPLRMAHVPTLAHLANLNDPKVGAVWDATFGQVQRRETARFEQTKLSDPSLPETIERVSARPRESAAGEDIFSEIKSRETVSGQYQTTFRKAFERSANGQNHGKINSGPDRSRVKPSESLEVRETTGSADSSIPAGISRIEVPIQYLGPAARARRVGRESG